MAGKLRFILAKCFGRERTSAKLNRNIDVLIPTEQIQVEPSTEIEFVWPTRLDPVRWNQFREVDGQVPIQEMPLRELANALRFAFHEVLVIPVIDDDSFELLGRATASMLGFSRYSARTQHRLEEAFRIRRQEITG